jgi:hypothetical protein
VYIHREVEMRIRAIVSIVPLLLPAALSAQRLPPIVDRRPGTDLPPQPPAIANDLGYRRWHLSFETYPIVSRVQAPGFTGVRTAPSWSTLGLGTRADYLVNRNVSATLDLTSSFIGGPVMVNTAEIGTRLHPEWAEHKLYPYVDLRVGYVATNSRQLVGVGQSYVDPVEGDHGPQYSRGFGVIGGSGLEYSFTRTWSLTTGASVVTSAMRSHDLSNPNGDRSFTLTALRYMIGVRYNPVTIVRAGDTR